MDNDEIEKVFGHRIHAPDGWIMAGRQTGKSEYTNTIIGFMRQQIEYIREYKDKKYTSVYMDYLVRVDTNLRGNMIEWCNENCDGHFFVAGSLFMFEQNNDAVAFALAW